MTDCREITRSAGSDARFVMSASVMPSLKYSCAGSPVRLASGRTASERMGARSPGSAPRRSAGPNAISSTTTGRRDRAAEPHRPAAARRRPARRPPAADGRPDGRRGASGGRHRRDEAVAAALQRLDEARVVRLVAERGPQAVDGAVQPVVEVDERVVRPQPLAQRLARDGLPGLGQQGVQDAQGLAPAGGRARRPCAARRSAGPARTRRTGRRAAWSSGRSMGGARA